ncbi:hypothetical protein DSECCO2_221480 [anaerobic digester metagenome]
MIYVFENENNMASVVFDGTTLPEADRVSGIVVEALPQIEEQQGKIPILKCRKDTGEVWYDYVDKPQSIEDQRISELQSELQNTKLALAELVEQQQADKLNNQLALAEVIESIMGGGTTA